tara:strand:+ start:906 stop:1340 length:435 start_codon:yes stop_codon:yes gene_type:complete
MEYKELKDRIKIHEGYRNTVYKDSLGFATVGYGHLVTPEDHYQEDQEYSKHELDAQFEADFQTAKCGAERLLKDINILFTAKCVIIEMVFQLGESGVSKFTNTLKALKEENYQEAAKEMLDSNWVSQTPERAKSLASTMRTCKI